MTEKKLTTIGRAETIKLLDFGISTIAKVDTGADLSSIWATGIKENNGQLSLVLFGPKHPGYTGQRIKLPSSEYTLTRVSSSFGHKEIRYVIKLRIQIKNRFIRATFSLADRKDKVYPVLLGRKLLKGKFLVDVSKGEIMLEEEKRRKQRLKLELVNARNKL